MQHNLPAIPAAFRDQNAQVLGYLARVGKPDQHTQLVPAGTCHRMIGMLKQWQPCGPERASEIVGILVGSYPHQPHEPEIYLRAIVSVLAEAPEAAAKEAINRVTRKQKFLPARAEIVEALNEIRNEQHRLEFYARKHIEEHKRREAEAMEAARPRATQESVAKTMARFRRAMPA